MSAKRTFWTKLNHDDARMAIEMMDDAEVGRWFRGWLAGAGGKEYAPDKIAALPVEMRTGFSAGRESFAEAERYSEKQRERVSKRYRGSTTVDHGSTTEEFGSENATETLPTNSQQPTAKSEEKQLPPQAPRGGKRVPRVAFVPPTEYEAKAFAKEIGFADVGRWMDHYRSNGWKVGKNRMSDWKACMRNWAANRFVSPGHAGPPGRQPVQWTGFDQTNYDQAKDQCRKDEHGNFLL